MNLPNKIQYVCYYDLLASVAAFISFVIVRNFELVFGRVDKMRRTGELMNDLGHVFICLLLLWLLIAIYRHFFQFSRNKFKSNKCCQSFFSLLVYLPDISLIYPIGICLMAYQQIRSFSLLLHYVFFQ